MDPQHRDSITEDDPSGLLTITAAAQFAGVSPGTVSGWITGGKLPAVLVAGRRRVRVTDLVATQAIAHLGEVVPAWREDRRRAGSRLRALREAAGLSQLQLAAASGLTHEAISALETGTRAPQAATVVKLAQSLAVAPERFVGDDQAGLTTLTVVEAASRLDVPAAQVLEHGEPRVGDPIDAARGSGSA